MEPLPRVFDFAFTEKPLIFLTRWGIFYEWWHCWRPVTSPTMVAIFAAILILPRIRNQVKTARNGNCLTWIITQSKHFAWFWLQDVSFIVEKSWKRDIHSHSKWLDHLLLITSYLVTIETDHHWTWLKMRARNKQTSTDPLYVRGLKCYFFEKGKLWQRTCLLEPKH